MLSGICKSIYYSYFRSKLIKQSFEIFFATVHGKIWRMYTSYLMVLHIIRADILQVGGRKLKTQAMRKMSAHIIY